MRKNFLKKAGLLSFCAALIMNVGTTFAAPTDVAVVQKALEEEKAAAFPVGVYNARMFNLTSEYRDIFGGSLA